MRIHIEPVSSRKQLKEFALFGNENVNSLDELNKIVYRLLTSARRLGNYWSVTGSYYFIYQSTPETPAYAHR